jgi:hypothetical protein
MVAAGPVAFLGEHPMPMLKKPPVYSVCLTRQQLYAVRDALRCHHRDLHAYGDRVEETVEYRGALYDALQKVHAILLDAGGVDDTL